MQISDAQVIIEIKDLSRLTDWEFDQFWTALGYLVSRKRTLLPPAKPTQTREMKP